jgi:hypothetical protein
MCIKNISSPQLRNFTGFNTTKDIKEDDKKANKLGQIGKLSEN